MNVKEIKEIIKNNNFIGGFAENNVITCMIDNSIYTCSLGQAFEENKLCIDNKISYLDKYNKNMCKIKTKSFYILDTISGNFRKVKKIFKIINLNNKFVRYNIGNSGNDRCGKSIICTDNYKFIVSDEKGNYRTLSAVDIDNINYLKNNKLETLSAYNIIPNSYKYLTTTYDSLYAWFLGFLSWGSKLDKNGNLQIRIKYDKNINDYESYVNYQFSKIKHGFIDYLQCGDIKFNLKITNRYYIYTIKNFYKLYDYDMLISSKIGNDDCRRIPNDIQFGTLGVKIAFINGLINAMGRDDGNEEEKAAQKIYFDFNHSSYTLFANELVALIQSLNIASVSMCISSNKNKKKIENDYRIIVSMDANNIFQLGVDNLELGKMFTKVDADTTPSLIRFKECFDLENINDDNNILYAGNIQNSYINFELEDEYESVTVNGINVYGYKNE